ncbi:MAG: hypothetical protein HQ485_06130 [Acidobacteria bacterium]|nr:hypothetical protein [Acidobacteriota bacterium]
MRNRLTVQIRSWILLATFVCMLGSTVLSIDHLGLIDSACGAFGLSNQPADAQVQSAVDGPLQHCPICHFLRSMNQVTTSTAVRVVSLEATRVLGPSVGQRARAAAVVHLPSRAPPASLSHSFS